MSVSIRVAAIVVALIGVAKSADAHGPTPQKVDEKISIAAPPADVWKVVKDFASIGAWHPSVAKVKTEGTGNDTTRTMTMKHGGDLVESLDAVDDKAMEIDYRSQGENDEAMPASSYSDAISVQPSAGGSDVEWISRLYRADTGNEPPEGKDDASAISAKTTFIKDGLAGLKAKLEAKK
jgi:mxaD protein